MEIDPTGLASGAALGLLPLLIVAVLIGVGVAFASDYLWRKQGLTPDIMGARLAEKRSPSPWLMLRLPVRLWRLPGFFAVWHVGACARATISAVTLPHLVATRQPLIAVIGVLWFGR
jgi:hypothetical protein